MGVHESNRGLCSALRRMFAELQCPSELGKAPDQGKGNTNRTPSAANERKAQLARLDQCRRIAERMQARMCTEPPVE